MERRTFLGLAAGAGLSSLLMSCDSRATGSAGSKLRIAIIGGGIVGASIAMFCARAGANVTLLEKAAPAAGATSKSFAWINAFHDDETYTGLRLEAIKHWQQLDKPLGMNVIWGGYVAFTDKPEDKGRFATQDKGLTKYGFPFEHLDMAALKQRAPEIDPGHLVEGLYSPSGGHVDPVHATNRFLAAATSAGAKILYPRLVSAIDPATNGSEGVTLITADGREKFDHVIVAAGVDVPALLAPIGYKAPLLYRPGALVHSKRMPIITKHVYDGPTLLEWRQAADGSFVGLDSSGPPKIPVHEAGILDHPMEFPPGIDQMHGERILSKLAKYVPAIKNAEYDHMTLGLRPYPVDDRPIFGQIPGVPGVSVCVTHSGMTLAALLGAYMANEVVGGKTEALMAPYRPARAFKQPPPA
ncbi:MULTISPECIES: NAD(P)/FAD-dependent oxidoreductase [unclassified Sphingobium]|uniref:NAD(P)/FAD-dependent oxidoreductase n=1 Tax=unclassified Sphingobium TaxID=2611147 RepID=UPI0035A5A76A